MNNSPTDRRNADLVDGGLMGMSGVFVPYNAGPVSTASTSSMYNILGGSGPFVAESAGVVSSPKKRPPGEMPESMELLNKIRAVVNFRQYEVDELTTRANDYRFMISKAESGLVKINADIVSTTAELAALPNTDENKAKREHITDFLQQLEASKVYAEETRDHVTGVVPEVAAAVAHSELYFKEANNAYNNLETAIGVEATTRNLLNDFKEKKRAARSESDVASQPDISPREITADANIAATERTLNAHHLQTLQRNEVAEIQIQNWKDDLSDMVAGAENHVEDLNSVAKIYDVNSRYLEARLNDLREKLQGVADDIARTSDEETLLVLNDLYAQVEGELQTAATAEREAVNLVPIWIDKDISTKVVMKNFRQLYAKTRPPNVGVTGGASGGAYAFLIYRNLQGFMFGIFIVVLFYLICMVLWTYFSECLTDSGKYITYAFAGSAGVVCLYGAWSYGREYYTIDPSTFKDKKQK